MRLPHMQGSYEPILYYFFAFAFVFILIPIPSSPLTSSNIENLHKLLV